MVSVLRGNVHAQVLLDAVDELLPVPSEADVKAGYEAAQWRLMHNLAAKAVLWATGQVCECCLILRHCLPGTIGWPSM